MTERKTTTKAAPKATTAKVPPNPAPEPAAQTPVEPPAPEPAPEPAPPPNYLDDDAALLSALADLVRAHPHLPPLIARTLTDEGLRAMPYLALNPMNALRAWVEVLPGRVYVRHTPDPIGGGTELNATTKLAGRTLVLSVTAWWATPPEFTAANGLVTRAHLGQLAQWERDSNVEHDVAPAAETPPIAPTVADPVHGKL